MEEHLGRALLPTETVDHINNDCTDNRLENLQLLSLKDNILKERSANPRKVYKFVCPQCGEQAWKWDNQVKHNKNLGKKGPFCSRSCAGKAQYKDLNM